MCLILLAHDVHPEYPLVVAANRDEFHERPAQPAHWREPGPVLGGRDERAGGSWLLVDANGRFAAVTNFRDRQRPAPGMRSRGELPAWALSLRAGTLAANIGPHAADYDGFSLLAGDAAGGLEFISNRASDRPRVPRGIHGLSNGDLDAPWPKVQRGRELLAGALAGPAPPSSEALMALLGDHHQPADDALPDTGIGLDRERMLAPMFIVSPDYGTRCSTVILVSRQGTVTFVERRYDPAGRTVGTVREHFEAAAPAPG